MSDSVRNPWAMVVPNGPCAAFSGIDVDPLMVEGRVGKQVDLLLGDR